MHGAISCSPYISSKWATYTVINIKEENGSCVLHCNEYRKTSLNIQAFGRFLIKQQNYNASQSARRGDLGRLII